ncbi:hypothetical protein BvCmsH15A_04873 [Escherichia coli]|nr:hypothetical protein BvCmsH15A_04873 [Escherichia coli]SQT10136.1 Uncharacterised protein [Escherichia coli]
MPGMRWTLDQKKHHVAAWRASGLTREQYVMFRGPHLHRNFHAISIPVFV